MKLQEIQISLSTNKVLTIYSDIGEAIYAAVENWSVRTKKHTEKSLCDYINSKGLHTAVTSKQAKEILLNK